MDPQLSVIIPCYNQGHYLIEALESLNQFSNELIETIIVNDGSTDLFTNELFKSLEKESKYRVIQQSNRGLSGARNVAILASRGKYVLPLDADNKLKEGYINTAVKILEENAKIAVVYSDAMLFGEQSGILTPGPFNLQRLMISNYIDACAVIRKSTLVKVGLYDEKMRSGWEDWDLWLRIAFDGYDFYYVNEVLFEYRITSNSMSRTLYYNYEKPNSIENYIDKKYPSRMGQEFIVSHYIKRFRKNPLLFIVKLFLKAYFPGYYNKLLLKNKIRNGL
jgi:glycosyltransferase involved in cell wall biosynthesis